MKMTPDEFKMWRDESAGYCKFCDDVTNDCHTEPDAHGYTCDACAKSGVMGIEEALLRCKIEIIED